MHRTPRYVATICALCFGITNASAESMTLVAPNEAAPVIVISQTASAAEHYAAEEMSVHLEKITGQMIEILDDSRELGVGVKVIALGRNQLTADVDITELGVEQYVTDIQPKRLTIVGGRRPASPGSSPTCA